MAKTFIKLHKFFNLPENARVCGHALPQVTRAAQPVVLRCIFGPGRAAMLEGLVGRRSAQIGSLGGIFCSDVRPCCAQNAILS